MGRQGALTAATGQGDVARARAVVTALQAAVGARDPGARDGASQTRKLTLPALTSSRQIRSSSSAWWLAVCVSSM